MIAKWEYIDGNQEFIRLTISNQPGHVSVADISLYGAHVVRWEDSNQSAPYLFLSNKAKLDGSKPIRGGVPICWPQFGPFGPLKVGHGFARRMKWKNCPELSVSNKNHVSVTLSLEPNDYTQSLGWNSDFRCEYTVKLVGCSPSLLDCSLKVINPKSSSQELTFTGALHTYYRISSLDNVTVDGLGGIIHDNRMLGTVTRSKAGPLRITEETDSFYRDTPDTLTMADSGFERKLILQKSGWPDAVVWNPHISGSPNFSDLGTGQYDEMLCVEAVIKDTPVHLLPGESWTGNIVQYWEQ